MTVHASSSVLNSAAVLSWLHKRALSDAECLDVRIIAGGQSNPTFALSDGRHRWVLRKQPQGELLPSAHAVDREFRIQQALADTDVPVPRMVAFCDDRSVLGTPFYLMDWLDGRVMPDYALPDVPVSQRRAYLRAMAQTQAALHRVDWCAAGLVDYGRPGNFYERQLDRWSRQWAASVPESNAVMDGLIRWLREHLPPAGETTVVHGDFRMGNLMFHPDEPRVIAVLDWELSTLGDPLSDVAYSAMAWLMRPEEFNGLAGVDLLDEGLPTLYEYLEDYRIAAGRADTAGPFHLAFAMFRFAAILAGVAARARQGNAAGENASHVGALAGAFLREATRMADNAA